MAFGPLRGCARWRWLSRCAMTAGPLWGRCAGKDKGEGLGERVMGRGGPRLASRWLVVGGGEVFAGAPEVRVSPDRRQIAYRWTRGDVPGRWAVDGVDWSGWAEDVEVAGWDLLEVTVGG